MNLGRIAVALAAMGALGLTTACGPSDSAADSTAGPAAGATATTTSDSAPAEAPAGGSAKAGPMKDGCDTVHQLFVALAAGDKTSAQSLKKKGAELFNDVAAAEAAQNVQLATDAAAMASMLDFELPPEPIYQSTLADTYKVDCVARYGAVALPTS